VPDHHGAFGEDSFGRFAEKTARFFGTPQYIVGQTIVVGLWILLNVLSLTKAIHWDARPFILLNLIFSTQAAYAAPLILLAQTRQADRDKLASDALEQHREEMLKHGEEKTVALRRETDELKALLESNTDLTKQDKDLTEQVAKLTREIHELLTKPA
jgi:uncharacterized membrane protein